jgi:hypothetical protein
MIEILTAEEYIKKHPYVDSFLSSAQGYEVLQTFMIEFAKLHVGAAQNEIIEHAILGKIGAFGTYWNRGDLVIDKDSVRNAYPLTNIK